MKMKFLRKLLRKEDSKEIVDLVDDRVQNNEIEAVNCEEIDSFLDKIKDIDIEVAIKKISNTQLLNSKLAEEKRLKAQELVSKGRYKEACKLDGIDTEYFLEVYQKGLEAEENKEFKKAANIYWHNIYINGTIAPASYNRLLILLRKMDMIEEEFIVAQIYLNFVFDNKKGEILKRIETIKNKLAKR